jgi:hypothetical protein
MPNRDYYRGNNGSNEVYSFLPTGNAQVTSFSGDLNLFLKVCFLETCFLLAANLMSLAVLDFAGRCYFAVPRHRTRWYRAYNGIGHTYDVSFFLISSSEHELIPPIIALRSAWRSTKFYAPLF